MIGSSTVEGFARQAKALLSTQLQALSSGVGGIVVLASRDAFCAGHPMVVTVAADLAGEVGRDVALYSAESRVKSPDVCTLRQVRPTTSASGDDERRAIRGKRDHPVPVASGKVAECHSTGEDV